MVRPNRCPHCGSLNTVFKERAGEWECQDCERRFPATAAEPLLADRAAEPKQLFFSYGHDANRELVDRFKADLERRGHTVWIDYKDIGAWDDWKGRITQGIHDADLAIAFLSKHSTRDPGVCRNEIAMALYHFSTAYPVLVEPKAQVDVPNTVKHLQLLDLQEWRSIRDGQVPGTDFESWYQERLIEITDRIEGECTQFADEARVLREVLRPASFDSTFAQHVEGFVGREWAFEEFERWLEQPDSRVFWLKAGPGFGKTAFAVNLADRRRDAVVGSWFCRQQSSELRDPVRALRTIAFQLALRWPDYRTRLLPRLNVFAGSAEAQRQGAREDIGKKNLTDLFRLLLAEPLAGLIPRKDKHVILIDALDEASDAQGSNPLTRLLVEQLELLPPWIGFLVTSRPDAAVVNLLQGYKPFELNGGDPRNVADLEAYCAASAVLQKQLAVLGEDEKQQLLQRLIAKSEGMVLYLKLIEEGLREGSLTLADSDALEAGLKGLFSRYLQGFEARFGADYESGIQPLLRLVVGAPGALPLELARQVLGWDREAINKARARIGSYLVDALDGVTLFHKSLAEWLTDSSSGRFVLDGEAGGEQLAEFLWKAFQETEDKTELAWPMQTRRWLPEWLPSMPAWRDINALELYGDYLKMVWRWEDAEAVSRRRLALCERLLGQAHPETADSLTSLAKLRRLKGDSADAEALHRRALEIREKVLGAEHRDTADSLSNLATLLGKKGDSADAEALHRRALEIREKVLGAEHRDTADSLSNLADLLRKKGDSVAAAALDARSMEIYAKLISSKDPEIAATLTDYAGELRAEASGEELRDPVPPREMADWLSSRAIWCEKKGKFAEAEHLYRMALKCLEEALGAEHPDTVSSINNLARVLAGQSDYAGAETLYRRALAVSESGAVQDAEMVSAVRAALVTLYEVWGKPELAERYRTTENKTMGELH